MASMWWGGGQRNAAASGRWVDVGPDVASAIPGRRNNTAGLKG